MNKETKAKICICIAMTIYGTIGLVRTYIPLESSVVACCRAIIGALVLFLFSIIAKKKINWQSIVSNLKYLIPSGIFLGANWIMLFESYRYASVAVGTLCNYMAPVIMIFIAPIFLKEKLTLKKVICALIAVMGMVFVSGVFEGDQSSTKLIGILLGLGSAVLYAAIVILNKKLKDITALDLTFGQLVIAAIVMIPYVLITVDFSTVEMTTVGWILLVVAGVVHTGIAYLLYFGSMADASAQTIALLAYIDPVISVILSWLVLNEEMTIYVAVGAVLIIGALVASEISFGKKKQPA